MTQRGAGNLGQAVRRVLQSGFFASPSFGLRLRHEFDRSVAWELVGGHVLDEAQTRSRSTFESWEVLLTRDDDAAAPQPLLAIFRREQPATLYVVRYLRVHGWEAYEAEPNVILSRPVEKWARELAGTVRIHDGTAADELAARLQRLVFQAFVGTRLPVTSWESPLPAFQLGNIAYLPGTRSVVERRGANPSTQAAEEIIAAIDSPAELLRQAMWGDVPLVVGAKGLEAALRASAPEEIPRLATVLVGALGETWGRHSCLPGRQECLPREEAASQMHSLFTSLFNHVALTPYTQLADNLVAILLELASTMDEGAAAVVDVISHMLRHLVRHLTAFDLRTFHNRGANYPDALFLDRLLKAYLALIERRGQHFAVADGDDPQTLIAKRRRRRALRQAWIVRKHYEGLKVPQSPTSPGDLQRVLPGEYAAAAVGEVVEEVFDPAKRRKTLFADDPLERRLGPATQAVLESCVSDLVQPAELRELGMATFLDRPLGIAKRPGEIDRTPLLTYEAFSGGIARQRLAALGRLGLLPESRRQEWSELIRVGRTGSPSYSGHQGRLPARPGTPCLEDANLAAPDFVFLRTSRASLDEFLAGFDWRRLRESLPDEYEWLTRARDVLLIRVAAETPANGRPLLAAIDGSATIRGNLCLPPGDDESVECMEEGGRELPTAGLLWKPPGPLANAPIAAPAALWSSSPAV